MTMNPNKQPSPSIAHPVGTYIMTYYADGSLNLNKIIGKVHEMGDGMWDVEADYPHHHTGKLFISSSAYFGVYEATDDDFKAFIIEQKESLDDLNNRPSTDINDMKPWFTQGIRIAYKWWKHYRRRKGMEPPPLLCSLEAFQ